jgi:hypothetical protein
MLDVATHFIRLEAKNKHLRSGYEFENSRVKVLADKLKVAEEALEEAKASLETVEQHLEDEKSARGTREGDIHKRLEALNTSLLSKYTCFYFEFIFDSFLVFDAIQLLLTEHPTVLLDHEKVDSTLAPLKLLEGNIIYGCNMINNRLKALIRLHGHVFPTEKLDEDYDLLELVRSFTAFVDPLINYC